MEWKFVQATVNVRYMTIRSKSHFRPKTSHRWFPSNAPDFVHRCLPEFTAQFSTPCWTRQCGAKVVTLQTSYPSSQVQSELRQLCDLDNPTFTYREFALDDCNSLVRQNPHTRPTRIGKYLTVALWYLLSSNTLNLRIIRRQSRIFEKHSFCEHLPKLLFKPSKGLGLIHSQSQFETKRREFPSL